jgi:hypothetical protein
VRTRAARPGEAALVIVAVNHKGADISPLLENAKGRTVVDTTAGDLDAAFDNALKKAQAAQASSGTRRAIVASGILAGRPDEDAPPTATNRS